MCLSKREKIFVEVINIFNINKFTCGFNNLYKIYLFVLILRIIDIILKNIQDFTI